MAASKSISMYDQLMQLPVFQGVTADQMTHILEVTPFDFKTFRRDRVIIKGGDTCQGALFVMSGKVRLETPLFSGRIKVTQVFTAPYVFSLHHLFGAERTLRSTLYSSTDKTGIMMLEKRHFLKLMQDNEIALVNTLNMLSTRAQKQYKAIDLAAETDPLLKLSFCILAFTDRAAIEVTFEALQDDWCEMLHIDAPSFWRCVTHLEGQKVVEVTKGKLKLLDRYGLKSFVNSKMAQNQ